MAYFVFTGGGTSGHVNPALAIAQSVRKQLPQAECLYIGKASAVEEQLAPKAGFPFFPILAEGFPTYPCMRLIKALRYFWLSRRVCLKKFKEKRPDAVISTGGYVSAPVVSAAKCLGIPILVHEQNALMGRSNRLLGKNIQTFCVSYKEALKKVLKDSDYQMLEKTGQVQVHQTLYWHTGNPLREEYLEKLSAFEKQAQSESSVWTHDTSETQKNFRILAVGGSLGSKRLNEVFIGFFEHLLSSQDKVLEKGIGELSHIHIVLSTGLRLFEDCRKMLLEKKLRFEEKEGVLFLSLKQGQHVVHFEVHPYLHNLADYMHEADLLVCRSGASTVFELMALGKPALFIPYPYAVEDHQWHNARFIVEKDFSYVCRDEQFTAQYLLQFLEQLSLEKLKVQGENLKKEAKLTAAQEIAEHLCQHFIK